MREILSRLFNRIDKLDMYSKLLRKRAHVALCSP